LVTVICTAMFATLTDLINVIVVPITTTIDTIIAAAYYFLAGSCMVGYCLVEGISCIWRILSGIYNTTTTLFTERNLFDGEPHNSNLFDQAKADGLHLAQITIKGVAKLALRILLLLPQSIILLFDYIIIVLESLGAYLWECGKLMFNILFRASIGIVVLLVLFMFRRYLLLLALYLQRKLSRRLHSVMRWAGRYTVPSTKLCDEQAFTTPGNRMECVICLERSRNIVLLPCRHLCLCRHCSQRLQCAEEAVRCPVCRNHVDTSMVVYS
ncbi:hypothetical protein KR222_000011, partial [Zaprionus bogoriensis]